jgi:hypothetical protein
MSWMGDLIRTTESSLKNTASSMVGNITHRVDTVGNYYTNPGLKTLSNFWGINLDTINPFKKRNNENIANIPGQDNRLMNSDLNPQNDNTKMYMVVGGGLLLVILLVILFKKK